MCWSMCRTTKVSNVLINVSYNKNEQCVDQCVVILQLYIVGFSLCTFNSLVLITRYFYPYRSKILAMKQALEVSKHVLWWVVFFFLPVRNLASGYDMQGLFHFRLDSDAIITRFDIPLLPYLLNLTANKLALFSSEFDQPLDADESTIEARWGAALWRRALIYLIN